MSNLVPRWIPSGSKASRPERERIERALGELRPAETGEIARVDQHLLDVASKLFEEELDSSFAEQLRWELELVERAEPRLAAGTYGISIENGKPIPDERLEVLPTRSGRPRSERYERELGYS